MEFHQKRRQIFLGEDYYHQQLLLTETVIDGPEGLKANLLIPETESGWHASLKKGIGFDSLNRMLLKYTAGEEIEPMRQEIEEIIHFYEVYGKQLWLDHDDRNIPVFDFEFLDDYCTLMQLIGLCFLLHRRDLLPRIAALQDGIENANGGFDWLFEEFMSFGIGPEKRFETDALCFARPYDFLADAMSSDDNEQALKDLHRYLKNWYKDLAGVFWHDSHQPSEAGNVGGYYGYWSFEAGAAVLLLGIEDDSSLHQYLYYPKDLVAWAREHADLAEFNNRQDTALRVPAGQPCLRAGYWFTPAAPSSRQHFEQGQIMPDLHNPAFDTIWQWDKRQG